MTTEPLERDRRERMVGLAYAPCPVSLVRATMSDDRSTDRYRFSRKARLDPVESLSLAASRGGV
jgi:hypothetical protein